MASLQTHMDARKFETLLKEKVDPQVCVVELVRGVNPAGKPFFVYIRLKPSEYMEYKFKLERRQQINPNAYEILEYGWGENPPLHMMETMEEKFGVDHDFENKVRRLQEQAALKVAG